MAVIKAKPAKLIPYLFPLLQRELIVPMLTTRVPGEAFVGSQGDTVTMKVGDLKAVARDYEWRTRTAPIVMDDISGGGGIPIKLDSHTYSATALTDENLKMDEVDLVREVLQPQVAAVALQLEVDVVAAYAAMPTRETVVFNPASTNKNESDPYLVALKARAALNRQKRAPLGGRIWLVGANVEQAILASDRFTRYDSAGSLNSPLLTQARIGNIAGFDVVVSQEVDPDFSVFTVSSSLVLGTVAPPNPRGATYSAAASGNGFAMRWLMDYDANFLRDRSVVSMFSGISTVFDEVFLTGTKAGQLKVADDYTGTGTDVPKSARAVKVTFTNPA